MKVDEKNESFRDEWRLGLQRSQGEWEEWIVERDMNEEYVCGLMDGREV